VALWTAIGTGGIWVVVLLLSLRWQPIWIGLSVVTLGIWAVATILGITLPVMETGTDPTQIPFAAIFAPLPRRCSPRWAPSPMCSVKARGASSSAC
jgi:hypothetical protein